ncbi:hypothetical protein C6A58_26155, partial [Escherichia coli]
GDRNRPVILATSGIAAWFSLNPTWNFHHESTVHSTLQGVGIGRHDRSRSQRQCVRCWLRACEVQPQGQRSEMRCKACRQVRR